MYRLAQHVEGDGGNHRLLDPNRKNTAADHRRLHQQQALAGRYLQPAGDDLRQADGADKAVAVGDDHADPQPGQNAAADCHQQNVVGNKHRLGEGGAELHQQHEGQGRQRGLQQFAAAHVGKLHQEKEQRNAKDDYAQVGIESIAQDIQQHDRDARHPAGKDRRRLVEEIDRHGQHCRPGEHAQKFDGFFHVISPSLLFTLILRVV